jgi:predicted regulator of Ras-like GTPase activity (Roadblock/LC7/MglB family)
MLNLPSLIDEDIAALDAALGDFVAASRARLAMFVDGGGFIVTRHGDEGEMDLATLGALAANSFAATQAIAKIIHEDSLLILSVEDFGFLAAVFPSQIGVGSVKFYSQDAIGRIGQQLAAARSRDPAGGLDLAAINLGDTGPFFRRRAI